MNPSAPEEVGKTARTFIEVLKDEPIALSLVVMNVLLLGFLYYTGIVAHDERKTEMQLLYENRSEMAKLLFQCVPADKRSGGAEHFTDQADRTERPGNSD